MKTIINPPHLAPARGFSHGIATRDGQTLYLAGQDAGDATGTIVAPGDIVAQYEQVLSNLRGVVEAAGGTMSDIVKLNIFVTDLAAYRAALPALGKIHRAYFGRYYPTIALVGASALFQPDALIEMEGVAVIEDERPGS